MTQDAGSAGGVRAAERTVVVMRDEFGAPFAVEVVDAAGWRAEFAEPPAPERADVRIVQLRRGRAPAVLPPWLHVEARAERVAEQARAYTAGSASAGEANEASRVIGERLWRASTRYRAPGRPLSEFLAAGALAVRYPRPAPTGGTRQRADLEAFARGRGGALGVIATVRGDALERWLCYAFGTPDGLADAVLLARIDDLGAVGGAGVVLAALRYLREAEVDARGATEGFLSELSWDRRALLEQASPWRYLELVARGSAGAGFAPALAAVRAWRVRYRFAYRTHYATVRREAAEAVRGLDAARGAAEALRRLDAVRALGQPVGGGALDAFEAARAELVALPPEPDSEAARTAGVTLGAPLSGVAQARAAVESVRAALEVQRARLASRTAELVLAREEVPALDRLLQVFAAGELEGLERVLDARVAGHIEALLAASVPAA